jgi:site-specific DNA-methyltransferase (adenine-specific)
MKTNDGTFVDNALKHGVAGINIDECRISLDGEKQPTGSGNGIDNPSSWTMCGNGGNETPISGRFPANIIHDGSDEVMGLFPNSKDGTATANSGRMGYHGGKPKSTPRIGYGGSGSSARFFYCAKASKSERNAGCEELEQKAMTELDKIGGEKSNFKTGSGKDRNILNSNNHPTVKPLSLMTYLTKLVKMPENTLILDPLAGSGSTLLGCIRNNINFIGIEMEAEYCEIAKHRIISEQEQLKLDLS